MGRTATASETSWLTGTAALLALIVAHDVVARLRFIPWVRRLVDPPVRVLIRDGHVDQRNLRRCRLTRDDLDAILREHGHDKTEDIRLALFETKGVVSILTDNQRSHKRA
ncbi:YetF domain-containing protein [Mycobacterium kansasii]|uniref:YetF domain-containing protein n=1 Tax=Mycobacterium kansasii TaxID=1768 RepID=UPI001FE2731D|nr:YetF domain-containing protein [Mycobacterium kansasii]